MNIFLAINKSTNRVYSSIRCDIKPIDDEMYFYIEHTEMLDMSHDYTYDTNTSSLVDLGINKDRLNINIKSNKNETVYNIVVTVSTGRSFDGDEKSQDRMLRAINIASITGQTETEWKLADNTIVMITLDELKEALALAGKEMSRIWLE